jgi:ABC-type transport system substrate-binding protein
MKNSGFRKLNPFLMALTLLTLGFIVACGASAPDQEATGDQNVVKDAPKAVDVNPTAMAGAQLVVTEVPKEVAKPADQVDATAMPKVEPTAMPKAEAIEYGGFITFMDYNAPTQKAIWEWAGSQLKNTSPVFNGLLEFNPETDDALDIRGDLAESWEQTDPTTYVFKLRQNAKWHDGVPVTADDIVFSLDGAVCSDCNGLDNLQGASRTGAIYTDSYYEVGNARAIDQYTIEVKTMFPAPAFIPTLALDVLKMLPKHTVIGEGKAQTIKASQDFNGSGPFLHTGYTKDVQNEYIANPDYWKEGFPRIDGMRHVILIDSGSQIAAFQTEQVMMPNWIVHQIGVFDAKKLAIEMEGQVDFFWAGPILGHGVGFNTTKAPFDDVRVRRAVQLAIDRAEFVEVLSGGVHWMGAPVPPETPYGRTTAELLELPGYRYVDGTGSKVSTSLDGVVGLTKDPRDIADAKALMAEAGHANGFDVTLSARNAVGYPDEAAIFAEQLKKIGINATIKIYESAAGFAAYDAGDFQFLVQGHTLALGDPDVIFGQFSHSTMTRWGAGGAAGANFEHPGGFEDLLKEQAQELDLEKRKAIVRQMEDILLTQDAQYIRFFWGARAFPVNRKVQGFKLHPSHYMLTKWEHIWCEKNNPCN